MMNLDIKAYIITALLALDIHMTRYAVSHLGAIELNPIAQVIGFEWLMAIKYVAMIAAVFIFFTCSKRSPVTANIVLNILITIYSVVFVLNAYQLVGYAL